MTQPPDPYGHVALYLQLDSTPDSVRDALTRVVAALSQAGVGDVACGMVELVIAESLNNVVEHAYRDARRGEISLHLALRAGGVEVTLRDTGRAMPQDCVPHPQTPALDLPRDQLPEGGFGWFLIRSLTSRLVYSRKGGQNRLHLRMDLAGLG